MATVFLSCLASGLEGDKIHPFSPALSYQLGPSNCYQGSLSQLVTSLQITPLTFLKPSTPPLPCLLTLNTPTTCLQNLNTNIKNLSRIGFGTTELSRWWQKRKKIVTNFAGNHTGHARYGLCKEGGGKV